jgi:hypothetical protein
MKRITNLVRSSLPKVCFALFCFASANCGNDFDPVSKVESVRILASRADKPYAKPGDSVELDLLAADGRKDPATPMALFWIPTPCVDPPDEAYDNCYPAFEGTFARGVDLTSQLVSGPRLSLAIPGDILARSASTQSGVPYANVFAFSIACAGHVEYVGQRGSSRQAVPFACFDAGGSELGADDFVFAYSRVFVFADRSNANPVIEAVTLDGQPIDPAVGLALDPCATPSKTGETSTCPTSTLDVVVPSSSQEIDPSDIGLDGNLLREGLWVDYYVTGGKVRDDVRILYDTRLGRVASSTEFEAPAAGGDSTMWAVVHDNRGGVSWTEIPIHTR